jgi:hypothetical protein
MLLLWKFGGTHNLRGRFSSRLFAITIYVAADKMCLLHQTSNIFTTHYYKCPPCTDCERPGYISRYSDSLRAGRSGGRILVGGEIFHAVLTGPRPTEPVKRVTVLSPGAKRQKRGAHHPPPSAGLRMSRSYTSISPLCLNGHVMG